VFHRKLLNVQFKTAELTFVGDKIVARFFRAWCILVFTVFSGQAMMAAISL
jgi:hypothetical protein